MSESIAPVRAWARMRNFVLARVDRKSEIGLRLTISLIVAVAALWAFGDLLSEVLEKQGLVQMDAAVERWFHLHATPIGLVIFNGITQLGSPVAPIVDALVLFALLFRRDWVLSVVWLGATAGGELVELALKHFVHRARPEYALQYVHGASYSFPSGHTMGATVCYGMLAYVLSFYSDPRGSRRTALYVAALVVVAAVGFSRLYLAVHFPSDVVGGFLAGLGWLAASVAAHRIAVYRLHSHEDHA